MVGQRRQVMLDCDLTIGQFANSMQRVYFICHLGYTPAIHDAAVLADLVETESWLYLAQVIVAMYLASEEADQTFTPAALAENCYNNLYRGAYGEEPQTPYHQQSAREQLTWEMIARHAATLCNADSVDNLQAVELMWGDKLLENAHTRGVILEPV